MRESHHQQLSQPSVQLDRQENPHALTRRFVNDLHRIEDSQVLLRTGIVQPRLRVSRIAGYRFSRAAR